MDGVTPRLHPMDLGQLLDTTFALYRRNFALFAGVVAVMVIPAIVINYLISLGASSTTTLTAGTTFTTALAGTAAYGGSGFLITTIFNTMATGALAAAISARYLGRPISILGAYEALGLGGLARLFFATLLSYVCIVFGLIAIIIGAIFLYVRLIFVPQTVVLEHKGVWSGLGRSWQLVSGSWWRVFGITTVLGLMVGIMQGTLGALIGVILILGHGAGFRLLSTAITGVISILVRPIQLGGLTLLYYDLRIRKEGFDLEQMADSIAPSYGL